MHSQGGMTLLEILVVLVISASLATLVVLRFSQADDEQLQHDSQRFSSLLKQHCQDAMLLNQVRGLSLSERGYRFWFWHNQQWQAAASDQKIYRPREWAADWDLTLKINGIDTPLNATLNADSLQPQIICHADGLLPVFKLRISSRQRHLTGIELSSNGGTLLRTRAL